MVNAISSMMRKKKPKDSYKIFSQPWSIWSGIIGSKSKHKRLIIPSSASPYLSDFMRLLGSYSGFCEERDFSSHILVFYTGA